MCACSKMSHRCAGITRAGKQCSITGASTFVDDHGRLVAEPLRRGGNYCTFHAKPFCTTPVETERDCVVIILDLETTGVDITRDRIVEMAATRVPLDTRFLGECFSMIVKVDPMILDERGAAAVTRTAELRATGKTFAAWGPNAQRFRSEMGPVAPPS